MAIIKTKEEVLKMKEAGKRVAEVLQKLSTMVKPGVALIELDNEAEKMTNSLGCTPAFKGYLGYPHSLCTSVNDQVVHGMPTSRVLKEGDIIGLDFGLVYKGYYGDSAITVPVGNVSTAAMQLMKTTYESLFSAIQVCTPRNTLYDIANAIESKVAPKGYGIVEEYVGHGIGRKLHEPPQVCHYTRSASREKLKVNMVICIEPMINMGSKSVRVLPDHWTVVTTDHSLSAHYEHSVLITESEPEVLTMWQDKSYAHFLF